MLLPIITDTHWGVRGDNQIFLDTKKKFLDNIFFPYLEENNITEFMHLGDLVDRRKYINFVTANRLRSDYLDPLEKRGIKQHIICGNHDVYYRNTNKVNALAELIEGKYNHIKIYSDPSEILVDDLKILLLPWINYDNYNATIRAIKETKAQICFGHLELQGFEMNQGMVNHSGQSPEIFQKFDIVCSGHYHHKSSIGNIHYLGAISEFTWADAGRDRGFHVFDTTTRSLTFIKNPYTIFKKYIYNQDDNETIDFSQFNRSYVKVVVEKKGTQEAFDYFLEQLNKHEPAHIQIIEDHSRVDDSEEEVPLEVEDTLSIFNKFIERLELEDEVKQKLNSVCANLYHNAITLEN